MKTQNTRGHLGKALKGRRLLTYAAIIGVGIAVVSISQGAAAPVPPSATGTLVSANPSDTTPNAQNGEVMAYAQIGGNTYVGGTFTSARDYNASTWAAHNYLFSYNTASGAINTGFAPVLDGDVDALAVSPDGKLIVGGEFKNANGVSRKNLVEVDPSTGATVSAWSGRSDGGEIRDTVVNGNWLYVAGGFHWIDGTAHSLVGRLNATTGAIDPTFQIDASVARAGTELVSAMAVSPDGKTMVIGGNFTQVNTLSRNQIAVIDLTGTPTVADWSTQRFVPPCYSGSFNSYVTRIDFADDSSYFIVSANGGMGAGGDCDAVSRWETSTRGSNIDHTWVDYTGTDSVTSALASDGVIYIGGHFRWVNNANGNDAQGPGGVDRLGIAALDPSNGLPLNWNPRRSAGTNLPPGGTAWGSDVPVLWRGSDGVYFGHNSDGMGSEYHGRMGMFPSAGGRTTATDIPTSTTPGFLYLGNGSGSLTKVAFTGTTVGAATTSAQSAMTSYGFAFGAGSHLYWSQTDSSPSGSDFNISTFNGTVSAPWTIGYNSWFAPASLESAFYVNGRMYYTKPGSSTLFYRFMEPDSYVVGCTEFTLPTQNIDWSAVRGMVFLNGKLIYGSTDGSLRSVTFDATAANGFAVDGSTATVVATAGTVNWNSQTLFYSTK